MRWNRPGTRLGSVRAATGVGAQVTTENDRTVQRRVGDLRPGTTYRYRFCMKNGARSAIGTL